MRYQQIFGFVAVAAAISMATGPATACSNMPCVAPQAAPAPQQDDPCMWAHRKVPTNGFIGCGWGFERLVDPETQYRSRGPEPRYYYVNQGPTFSGPGAFAPYPIYKEGVFVSYGEPRHRHVRTLGPVLRSRY